MKVTIYTRKFGMLKMGKIEATLKDVKLCKWAQYENAVMIEFIQKRKRTPHTEYFASTHGIDLLIVEGWNNPEPLGMWDESTRTVSNGLETKRGRYSFADPRLNSDFNSMIDAEIAAGKVKVLHDFRNHECVTRG